MTLLTKQRLFFFNNHDRRNCIEKEIVDETLHPFSIEEIFHDLAHSDPCEIESLLFHFTYFYYRPLPPPIWHGSQMFISTYNNAIIRPILCHRIEKINIQIRWHVNVDTHSSNLVVELFFIDSH